MKSSKFIKSEILQKVKEYHDKKLREDENKFILSESRINYAGRIYDKEELTNLVDASLDFWLTAGNYAEKFEKEFAEFLDVKYCSLVNSGSSANLLAFMALTSPLLKDKRIKRGDEVITVACAFPTTVSPIIMYGATPVFVDIDIHTLNIDTIQLERALSNKTKVVMLAHTLGNPFDINTVKEFCDKHDLWLIEDNCDALGSMYSDKYTGIYGDIGTSSFYPPHHITMGQGGAVYTNDTLLNKIIVSMRDWGRDCICHSGRDNSCGKRFSNQYGKMPQGFDHKYIYSHAISFNLEATDLQASIGCAQLKKLPGFIVDRHNNFFALYKIFLKYEDYFCFPHEEEKSEPSYFGFWLSVKEEAPFTRNEIVQYFEKNLIQTRMVFAGNIIRQPGFSTLKKDVDYRVIGDLKNTDYVMNNTFWLGVYSGIKEEHLNYIAKVLDSFMEKL